MNVNKIIYQLTVEDVQKVALDMLDRKLSAREIKSIIERIAEQIPWYDAIANSISELYKATIATEEE
jgi:ATP-dependent protease Clp ATPase subunit